MREAVWTLARAAQKRPKWSGSNRETCVQETLRDCSFQVRANWEWKMCEGDTHLRHVLLIRLDELVQRRTLGS